MKKLKKLPAFPLEENPGDALFLELMMQMLAFFILLTSMAVIVDEKRMAALGSLAGTFSPLPRGANVGEGEGPSLSSRNMVKKRQTPRRTAKEISEVLSSIKKSKGVSIDLAKDSIRISLPESILFKKNSIIPLGDISGLFKKISHIIGKSGIELIEIYSFSNKKSNPELSERLYISIMRASFVLKSLDKKDLKNKNIYREALYGDKDKIKIILKFSPTVEQPKDKKSLAKRNFKGSSSLIKIKIGGN